VWTVAADELATALIPAVWTFLGVVVVTLGTIFVQSIKSRSERPSTPPAPTHNGDGASLLQVARDVAHDIGQLHQRANDNDERDDWQDKRLNAIERHLDDRNPDWRRR
jgi:hypothetical protein